MDRSYYIGRSARPVPLATWDEVVSAAHAGVLDETQWVELKRAVPATSKRANLELACDLASLSIDGGLLVIGIADADGGAGDVVGTTLDGLTTRIDQVAGGTVTPPLNVAITTVAHPTDPELGVLLVEVPASLLAPHMVDGSYWGRGAQRKRKLSDPEVRRLLDQRDRRDSGFVDRLLALPEELDPVPESQREDSHLCLLLEPQTAVTKRALHEQLRGTNALQALLAASPGVGNYPPTFQSINHITNHPDGFLLTSSVEPGSPYFEERLIQLVLGDDGGIRLVSGRASFERATDINVISAEHVVELTHHTVHAAGRIAQAHLGFNGQWQVGVYLDRLAGKQSSRAAEYGGRRLPPYPNPAFQTVITATTRELVEDTPAVVRRLLGRFLRGLGLDAMAQYTDLEAALRRAR